VTPEQADAYAGEVLHIVAAVVGFSSYFLLWAAVLWGLMLRNGWAGTRMRHSTIYSIHMTVALFGISLGLVHAGAQLAVPNGHVTLIDEFVPFTNEVDPIGVGIATIATELFVAAWLAVGVQKKLGYSRFRAVHSLVYIAFMLVAGHALISGSDMEHPLAWGSVLGSVLLVIGLWLSTTGWVSRAKRARADQMAARQQSVESVTVNVDPVRCARFGFCEQEAPDVFQIRGDGRLSYKAAVTVDELNPVVRAVEVCPARAIMLGKMPSSMLVQSRGQQQQEEPAPPQLQDNYPTSPGLGPVGNGRVASLADRRRRSSGGRR
jgi:ferredoxin/DMSO/TMAO reductase YedYZ heme-binding membrane subunit